MGPKKKAMPRYDEQLNAAINDLAYRMSLMASTDAQRAVSSDAAQLVKDWRDWYFSTIPRDVFMSESSYRSALDRWAAQLAKLEARAESVMGRRVATLPVNRRGPVGTDWSREAGQELRRAVPSVAGWGGLALLVGIAVLLSWRR